MKLHLHSSFNIVKRTGLNLTGIMLIMAASCLLPASVTAQQRNLQVISDDSTANLFLGSRENPTWYSAGTARVSGHVDINQDDISQSAFSFTVYPANRTLQDPEGAKSVSGGDQPAISFQSQQVTLRNDGSLEVAGQLTVTRVFRNAVVNQGEAYAGPEYGPPVVSKSTQPATFTFARPLVQSTPPESVPEGSDGVKLLRASHPLSSTVLLTATAMVNGETFPELASSVADTVWPVPVNDQDCTAPSSAGEDYSGAVCSGTIADSLAPATLPAQAGEDYAGAHFAIPSGGQVTIQLHLELADAGMVPSAGASGSGNVSAAVREAAHKGSLR